MARVTFLCELAVLFLAVCCVSSILLQEPDLRRPCRSHQCYRACEHGYVTVNGCQTCHCLEGPVISPPRPLCGPTCRKFCPNGFVLDSRGCPTCTCKDHIKPPVCGPTCEKFCPRGYLRDSRGCPTCECRPCPMIKCSRHCPNGYKYVRGCQTCTCKDPKPPVCGPLCRMACPNGFVTDSRGCPICKCKPFLPSGNCSRLACAISCFKGTPLRGDCTCPPCGGGPRYELP